MPKTFNLMFLSALHIDWSLDSLHKSTFKNSILWSMPSIQRHSKGLQTRSSKNSEIQTLTTLNDGLTWQLLQRQFTLTWFWYLHEQLNFDTVFAAGHKNIHISAKHWTACTSHSNMFHSYSFHSAVCNDTSEMT